MKNLLKNIILLVSIVILTGCGFSKLAHPSIEKSTFIVMKTPVFRYADQGFVQIKKGVTKIEIYANGTAIMKLEVFENRVCNGNGLFTCIGKKEFNKRYLSPYYPDNIFGKIFRGEKIFAGINLHTLENGFSQVITKEGEYNIAYTVLNGSIVFRDTISHILIKVKENR